MLRIHLFLHRSGTDGSTGLYSMGDHAVNVTLAEIPKLAELKAGKLPAAGSAFDRFGITAEEIRDFGHS
jgi:hypothetical protein